MSTVAAPPAPETKPVEAPAAPTAEQIARKQAFLDRITGKTSEEAQKTVAGVKEFEQSHVERATRMPKTKAQIEEEAAKAKEKTEAAAKAAAAAKEPPKEPKEPETKEPEPKAPEAKPKRTRRTVAEEDERIATVAAQAATKAVQATLPKPEPKPEPAAKYEDTLPKSEKRKLETLQELERLYPDKKGVVQAFVEGAKAYDEYVKNWEKENQGRKFNESDEEHNSFFEAQESKLNYTEDEFEEANEGRIARKAREQFETEHSAKETERDRKIRMIEEKENLAQVSDHAGAKVLELLEIPKLEDAPAEDRDTYAKGVKIAKDFATAAYSVMNGLVQDDPNNPTHQEVAAVSVQVMKELGELPPEDTKNAQGQTYAQPWDYDALTPAQRKGRWTLGAIDVIEYKAKHLSDQVRNHIKNENEKFEARAKSRGMTLETAPKKPEPKPANPAPSPAPAARKGGAPALGSDVISVAPSSGTTAAPKKGRDFLASLWAPK